MFDMILRDPFETMPVFDKQSNSFMDLFRNVAGAFDSDFGKINSYYDEKTNKNIVEINMPGIDKKNISMSLDNGYLKISAENKKENEIKDKHVYRKEFSYQSFSEVIPVDEGITEKDIDAMYENGILKIEMPNTKKIENKDIKKIEIK